MHNRNGIDSCDYRSYEIFQSIRVEILYSYRDIVACVLSIRKICSLGCNVVWKYHGRIEIRSSSIGASELWSYESVLFSVAQLSSQDIGFG